MSYDALTQPDLARLVPELLLSGHLIDRSGMAHILGAFGQSAMTQVAIEEWMGASPVYTRRMRTALGLSGDTVAEIFKMMQLDVGAPPQFMDFRYTVIDDEHGEFHLNHCGALLDVEPLGDVAVKEMCHDIEDPTFEATAIATNPKARFRPIHRPPRVPADRHPHCAWTVCIAPEHDALPLPEQTTVIAATEAANVELSDIDPTEDGITDYRGPLTDDLQFRQWSRSALIRIAEEVALQHHLLSLSFDLAVRGRCDADRATDLLRKQFTGVAGVGAARIRQCLDAGSQAADLARVIRLHPALNPVQYTGIEVTQVEAGGVAIRLPGDSPAMRDRGWLSTIDTEHCEPLEAIAVGVDPHWNRLTVSHDEGDLVVEITWSQDAVKPRDEVVITEFSKGAAFEITDRGIPLPLTPI
ncbi:hypothetical protein MKUB_24580 [Mycobacterium kubicae]|uniref:Uncharacterized protein n=1 Tax=Mycobacterium kubicae TaxID=120959 RepID=A0AAX1JF91_9MYCO|nr:hypothetical protein [Mycobacterium kubicae]MCV7095831.1 hypothetical protein [Mycobacterium kubicae]ORV99525.1 hypothetical protein AWC13_10325 [Mycobacterium kubicae]QNI12013.1 hypothetical protein GAN18_13070 [Mycobacterium kubicae]QPI40239.1 hypothetical protein I2456_12890 [Mycobacterium kubicae]GFG64968.1 hypothetical protein MKUB_24580 [Mycobacterium kubicae]